MNLGYEIENSTAHRPIRDKIAKWVLEDEALFRDLFNYAMDTTGTFHFKACWILELVLERNIWLLQPFLDDFCIALAYFKNQSALRSVSKICLFVAEHKFRQPASLFASEAHYQRISEACLDWLISDGKVALKAYSMWTLFYIGKDIDWIYPELESVLQKDFYSHSAAYKAAAKEILKKLKR